MTRTGEWTRRQFVSIAGAAAAASMSAPALAEVAHRHAMRGFRTGRRAPQSDDQWRDVLAAFDLGGRATMNTANLAPASAPSRAVLAELSAAVDADPSFQSRARFSTLRQSTREAVAGYLGADPSEIVLTRNTTEGNNFVVQGVELGPGDEVLLTEHNHEQSPIVAGSSTPRRFLRDRGAGTDPAPEPGGSHGGPGRRRDPANPAYRL